MIASFTKNGKTASVRLPVSGKQLASALSYIGAERAEEYGMPCSGNEYGDIEISLHGESSAEALISMVAGDKVTFWKLNRALTQMYELPYANRLEIEHNLMNIELKDFADFEKRLDNVTPETVTTKYYFPLTVMVHGRDTWGGIKENGYEEDGEFAARYEKEIRNMLYAYNSDDEETMASYFYGNNSTKAKLLSTDWDFERRNGELYGRVTVKTEGPLTDADEQALKDWITGQNSDGLGEGFEQQEIDYDHGYYGGVMYVSFWNSSDDYYVDNEDEFAKRLENQSMTMGGM